MAYIRGKPSNNYNERRNYYMKKGKAYLFNNVVVRKIYVYNIPIYVSPIMFHNHFKTFGKVTECFLNIQQTRQNLLSAAPLQIGFALFKNAEDAARALTSSHEVFGRTLGVRAAHTWHQPDDKKVKEQLAKIAPPTEEKISFHVFDLTPLNIAQILRNSSLRERLSLVRCHELFRSTFEEYCLIEYKQFNGFELFSLTQGELRNFWKIVGPSVEALTGSLPFRGRCKMVQQICKSATNLKVLRLKNAGISEAHFALICSSLQQIREVDLENSTVDDRMVLALSTLPGLEVLKLNHNFALQGRNLRNLVNLKELSLGFCPWISSLNFLEAIRCLHNLQVLNIYGCRRLDNTCFIYMPMLCTKLENLKLHYCGDLVHPITELPALKILEIANITRTNPIAQSFYESLVQYKSDQLEKLTIRDRFGIDHNGALLIAKLKNLTYLNVSGCLIVNDTCLIEFAELEHLEEINLSYCGDVQNAGVKELFRTCLKLKRVDLEFCNQITSKLLEFADIIFRSRDKKTLPIICNGYKSGIIEKEVQKEPYYNSSVEYIELIFECSTAPVVNGVDAATDIILSDDDYEYDDTEDDSDDDVDERIHMMRQGWYADEDDAMRAFFGYHLQFETF